MKSKDVSLITVTPAMAQEILNNRNYEHNRKINKYHVNNLARAMSKGEMAAAEVIQFHRNGSGNEVLIDGQQRLSAVVKVGKPMQFISVVLSGVSIEMAYASIDVGRSRNIGDALEPYGVFENTNLSRKRVRKLAVACKYIHYGYSRGGNMYNKMSLHEHANLIKQYLQPAEALHNSTVDGFSNAIIFKPAVLCVALTTQVYKPKMSAAFWANVAFDDSLPTHAPEKALLRFDAKATRLKALGSGNPNGISTHDVISFTAHCWNKGLTRTPMMKLVCPKSFPGILGTPIRAKKARK